MSLHRSSRTLLTFVIVVAGGVAPLASNAAGPGEQAFAECMACHSVDGTNGVGPTLKGVVGRASASVPGFAYSSAFKRAQFRWTTEQLDKYVADPQAVVPGNVMPYAGMPDPVQRAALIAYLATLK
jgi:cytochrome c